MSESLTYALHKIEGLVTDALGNRHSTFSVKFPYKVNFTFPDDDHNITITIDTTSEALRYGRDEQDIFLQMQLDQDQGDQHMQNTSSIGSVPDYGVSIQGMYPLHMVTNFKSI